MSKLTEEEKELLEEMSRQVKKDKAEDGEWHRGTEETKELKEKYYKEHPDKRPYLRKKRDQIRQIRAEHKKERVEERRIYKESYQKQKKKSVKARAKRKAKARFGYTTVEKVTGTIKRAPSTPKKRRRTIPKARSIRQSRQPVVQQPRMISFDDALGSFGKPVQRRTTQPDYKPQIDFGSGLGTFGKKNKKKKPIDPFEKLF